MTLTYDLATTVGQIRLIIGDKDLANAVFTDEELTAFFTMEGSVNLAAAAALEAWAASYAANADSEKIGGYNYSQTICKKMMDLAARLRTTASETPASTWAEMDLLDEDEDL